MGCAVVRKRGGRAGLTVEPDADDAARIAAAAAHDEESLVGEDRQSDLHAGEWLSSATSERSSITSLEMKRMEIWWVRFDSGPGCARATSPSVRAGLLVTCRATHRIHANNGVPRRTPASRHTLSHYPDRLWMDDVYPEFAARMKFTVDRELKTVTPRDVLLRFVDFNRIDSRRPMVATV